MCVKIVAFWNVTLSVVVSWGVLHWDVIGVEFWDGIGVESLLVQVWRYRCYRCGILGYYRLGILGCGILGCYR